LKLLGNVERRLGVNVLQTDSGLQRFWHMVSNVTSNGAAVASDKRSGLLVAHHLGRYLLFDLGP
jgi:hypothetical protein